MMVRKSTAKRQRPQCSPLAPREETVSCGFGRGLSRTEPDAYTIYTFKKILRRKESIRRPLQPDFPAEPCREAELYFRQLLCYPQSAGCFPNLRECDCLC